MSRKEEIVNILANARRALTTEQVHASLPLALKGSKDATRATLYGLVKAKVVQKFSCKGKVLLYGIGIEKADFTNTPSRRAGSWGDSSIV